MGLLDLKSSPLLLPSFLLLLPSLQKQQIYPTAEAPVRIDDPSLNMSFKHSFQVKVKQHFLHEKGREQTLRRETWSTLLQITLRVFFMSQKHGNHKNKHEKSRNVLFLEKKKGPCQEAGMPHPSLYRSKMSPLTFPTHRNPLNPFSHSF